MLKVCMVMLAEKNKGSWNSSHLGGFGGRENDKVEEGDVDDDAMST